MGRRTSHLAIAYSARNVCASHGKNAVTKLLRTLRNIFSADLSAVCLQQRNNSESGQWRTM